MIIRTLKQCTKYNLKLGDLVNDEIEKTSVEVELPKVDEVKPKKTKKVKTNGKH